MLLYTNQDPFGITIPRCFSFKRKKKTMLEYTRMQARTHTHTNS